MSSTAENAGNKIVVSFPVKISADAEDVKR